MEYARISLTDRCAMACVYCMPPQGEAQHTTRAEAMDVDDVVAIAAALVRGGVRRVRWTGGEPLIRKDIVALTEAVRARTQVAEMAMTTNGSLLAERARDLASAGLDGVNVSVDSLDPARFAAITRGGSLRDVLRGIEAAQHAGLEVKINCVVLGGVNDDEVGAIVDWAWAHRIVPRFIELMPIGEGATLPAERFVSVDAIVRSLDGRVGDLPTMRRAARGPAKYRMASDGSGRRVGFITAVSDEFCGGCNRVRITARGEMRACLASRRAVSLRDLHRAGASGLDLLWAASWSLRSKDTGHHFLDPAVREHELVGMSLIGG